jgi:hypothetical protein
MLDTVGISGLPIGARVMTLMRCGISRLLVLLRALGFISIGRLKAYIPKELVFV